MAKKKKGKDEAEEAEAPEEKKDAKAKGKGKDKDKAAEVDKADGAAEATEGEGAEGEGGKKKLPIMKLAIFAGVPLVLIIIGVAAAFMLGLFGGKHEEEAAHEEPAKAAAEEVQFYDLPEILVNLNTGGKSETYLKLHVAIEISKDVDVATIEPALPRILDRYQVFLRELRLEDLSGSSGTYRLKQELLRRVRGAGLGVEVNDVLIREMIIQ